MAEQIDTDLTKETISATTQESYGSSLAEIGPGATLRKAREAAGYTIDQLADRLRLSPAYLQKIERDDYTGASLLTYERGYIRAYAKVLGISESLTEELVESFNRLGLQEKNLVLGPGFSWRKQPIRERHLRWISYLVGLVMVVLAAMWWQTQSNRLNPSSAQATQVATTEAQNKSTEPQVVTSVVTVPATSTETTGSNVPAPSVPNTTTVLSSQMTPLTSNPQPASPSSSEMVVSAPQKPTELIEQSQSGEDNSDDDVAMALTDVDPKASTPTKIITLNPTVTNH